MFKYTGSRVAFSLFGIDVYWYAILIVIGMMLAFNLSANELKRKGKDPEIIYELALWILPSGVIGARLYYVIFEFSRYSNIMEIINTRDGGLAIHGGILVAVLVGTIYLKFKKINFFELSDIILIFLPLAQAIGRWGNFINNEAHGGPTNLPWAVIIDGKSYHPTFFYESISTFIIFLCLWFIYRNKEPKLGTTTSLYLIFYGIVRFFVEGLRTDSLWWGPIRVAQLVSLIFIVLGLVILFLSRKNKLSKIK